MASALKDRVAGVMVASCVGDALGAPYEFGSPIDDDKPIQYMTLKGALGHKAGEWTDDTSMAVPILQAVADHKPLEDATTLDAIVDAWRNWAKTSLDVGIQTQRVLSGLPKPVEGLADVSRELARQEHEAGRRTGGNGSLMRTAPVAFAYLGPGQEEAMSTAARAISKLTHYDDEAGDACVLWCTAIRTGILTGALDIKTGLGFIPESRRQLWETRITSVEKPNVRTRHFTRNGWVVEALQAAWCAIYHAQQRETPSERLKETLEQCVRGGNDTDTVATIAGALAGAVNGMSAVPAEWSDKAFGWPNLKAADLADLAIKASKLSQDLA